jgi:hypothetical protein
MPNRTRSNRTARQGRNWSSNELDAYNIRITTVDTNTFFGISELPTPAVSPVIFNHADAPSGLELSFGDSSFFRALHHTTLDRPGHRDWYDLSYCILGPILQLETAGPHGRILYQLPKFQFIMNNRRVYATPSASIHDLADGHFVLLVETETTETVSFPLLPSCCCASLTPTKIDGDREGPRLVADALAAFTADNNKRTDAGLAPMASQRYIGMGMIRSAPRLYKITITQALLNAVVSSQPPAEETIIERFVPPVPNMDNFIVDGMVPLQNRYICFQCFEALKALL